MPQYWLMKSEPTVYSIDDLARDKKTYWDGVRNYQARNFMRDQMKIGNLVLFYHSNTEPSGVAGIAKICRTGYPDFDCKSSKENPLWFMADIAFVKKIPRYVSLDELKKNSSLKDMLVVKRGSRLSVQPVLKEHFDTVCRMGNL